MRDARKRRTGTLTASRARDLRQRQTLTEMKLWRRLRDRRLGGFKFRRQYPMGRFIVDFYCAACKVVVEVDGDSHAEQLQYDAARTESLQAHGCRVIRFTNREVGNQLAAVLEAILEECQKREQSPHPRPARSLPGAKRRGLSPRHGREERGYLRELPLPTPEG